jgi:hypothetical protein
VVRRSAPLPRGRSATPHPAERRRTRVYPFEEIQQAAENPAAGTVVKPVLKMPDAAGG